MTLKTITDPDQRMVDDNRCGKFAQIEGLAAPPIHQSAGLRFFGQFKNLRWLNFRARLIQQTNASGMTKFGFQVDPVWGRGLLKR